MGCFERFISSSALISWFDLDYGGNPEGIFSAACPPEPLHALENGIFLHVLKELFQQVFNTSICVFLDHQVSAWNYYPGQHFLCSSNIDGYPRLLFHCGISKLTDIKADDKVGIIFCVVVALLQAETCEMFATETNITKTQISDIILALESMLCYRAWLKLDSY